MKKNLLIHLILLIIFTQSCGSFSRTAFKKDFKKLTPENYTELNGIYYNHPKQVYEKIPKKIISENALSHENIFAILNFRPQTIDSITISEDRKEEKRLELRFETNQKLRFNYIVDGKIQAYQTINGKIKNGFFYLDNKISSSWGVPLLYGGYEVNKHRIGMSKNGNLILNSVSDSGGSFLVIFSNGTGSITSYEVEKIK